MPKYKQINEYILDAIDGTGYNISHFQNDKEKLQFLKTTFESEYSWALKKYSVQNALSMWLTGLPSCINIAFNNHDILDLAHEWGSLPENSTVRQENKILTNYWQFMAVQILKLFRKHKI